MPFKDRHCKIGSQRIDPHTALSYRCQRKQRRCKPDGANKPVVIGLLLALVMTVLFLAPLSASADFYSYVDARGVLHISNVPVSARYSWMMPEKGSAVTEGEVVSYDTLIYNVSRRYGVDPNLIKAVVRAESDYNPSAVSRAGARGLMQLMPETARLMGVKNIHDPADNVSGGTKYLSGLIKKFNGKLPMALAAYNAGEGAVRRYGAIPPFKETELYVKKVLRFYSSYSGRAR